MLIDVQKEIDENLDRDWTKEGVLEAVNNLIKDNSAMLFKDITKNIENNPDLKKLLRAISLENFKISYYADIFPVLNLRPQKTKKAGVPLQDACFLC